MTSPGPGRIAHWAADTGIVAMLTSPCDADGVADDPELNSHGVDVRDPEAADELATSTPP